MDTYHSAQRTIQRLRIVCVMHAAARTNRRALSVPGRQGSTTPPQREQGCGERGRAENVPIAAGRLPRSGVMRRAHGGRPGAGTTGTAPKRTTASRCELANRQAFRGRTATRVNPSPRASGATVDRSAVGPFGWGIRFFRHSGDRVTLNRTKRRVRAKCVIRLCSRPRRNY